jgi:hypothetical protein
MVSTHNGKKINYQRLLATWNGKNGSWSGIGGSDRVGLKYEIDHRGGGWRRKLWGGEAAHGHVPIGTSGDQNSSSWSYELAESRTSKRKCRYIVLTLESIYTVTQQKKESPSPHPFQAIRPFITTPVSNPHVLRPASSSYSPSGQSLAS